MGSVGAAGLGDEESNLGHHWPCSQRVQGDRIKQGCCSCLRLCSLYFELLLKVSAWVRKCILVEDCICEDWFVHNILFFFPAISVLQYGLLFTDYSALHLPTMVMCLILENCIFDLLS